MASSVVSHSQGLSLVSELWDSWFLWDHVKQMRNLEMPVLTDHFMVSIRMDFLNNRNFPPTKKKMFSFGEQKGKKTNRLDLVEK